jgi:hypothetical protein
MRAASRQGSGGGTLSESGSPFSSSKAIQGVPVSLSQPTSCTITMLGCWRAPASRASVRKRFSKISRSEGEIAKATWIVFSARLRPSTGSLAS